MRMQPDHGQIAALMGCFGSGARLVPAGRADPRRLRRRNRDRSYRAHRISRRTRRRCALVQVSVDSSAGNIQHRRDLCHRLLPRVVELLGEHDLIARSFDGRPPVRPRARAAANPSRVFATISSRWSSASTESIPNIARPSAVAVSMPCSRTFNPIPCSRKSAPRVIRCNTERPNRSSRVITNVSPLRRRVSTASSCGRRCFRTARVVGVDVRGVDPRPRQGVDLVGRILICARHPGVTEQHLSKISHFIVFRQTPPPETHEVMQQYDVPCAHSLPGPGARLAGSDT